MSDLDLALLQPDPQVGLELAKSRPIPVSKKRMVGQEGHRLEGAEGKLEAKVGYVCPLRTVFHIRFANYPEGVSFEIHESVSGLRLTPEEEHEGEHWYG